MKSDKEIIKDYHLFLDVQTGKYLKSANKTDFSNDAEARRVIGQIVNVYNQQVAPDCLQLDNPNDSAKIAWFNSIEVDFDEEIDEVMSL